MEQSKGFKRFSSFAIDIVILIFIYYIIAKLAESFFDPKDLYPPVHSMVFYTKAQFIVYFISMFATLLLASVYLGLSYFKYSKTLGQHIVGIAVLSKDGSQLTKQAKQKLLLASMTKILVCFVPGPGVALLLFYLVGKGQATQALLTLVVLICGGGFLLINPLVAYFKEDKASWVEKKTKTRIFDV